MAKTNMPASPRAAVLAAPGPLPPESLATGRTEASLKPLFTALRNQTGHDFSGYKLSAIQHQVTLRMQQCAAGSLAAYLRQLQQSPAEVDALFRALMRGLTHFFADEQAISVLQEHILPKLFAHRSPDTAIRIWMVGCSTGEEAYSLAILLQEHMLTLQHPFPVQIFASDTDSQAIASARAGRYSAGIATDVSAARLARFFSASPDGKSFRINKAVRDMLVFFEQDLARDPPFSKIDLIGCSNMLVYHGEDLPKKIIPLFHYALKPEGLLFLGSAKGLHSFSKLFVAIDRKARLYRRHDPFTAALQPPLIQQAHSVSRLPDVARLRTVQNGIAPMPRPLRELTESALLQELGASAALVDEHGDILYLHGRTGLYLEPSAGETGTNNMYKMAREGLRPALRAALRLAKESKASVRSPQVRVKTNHGHALVNLHVRPINGGVDTELTTPLYLVLMRMDDARATPSEPTDSALLASDVLPRTKREQTAQIAALTQQLRGKDEQIERLLADMALSNEALLSSYTDVQAAKEDLQASHEELETSKEELQSSHEALQLNHEKLQSRNEELAAINAALQASLAALSRSQDDLEELLASSGMGFILVDPALCIQRFTPNAHQVMHLIAADIGRPVAHLASNLSDYESLLSDVRAVLETRVAKVLNVQTMQGTWYTMRIQPYHTPQHAMEGAVISFVEIADGMRRQQAIRSY